MNLTNDDECITTTIDSFLDFHIEFNYLHVFSAAGLFCVLNRLNGPSPTIVIGYSNNHFGGYGNE